MFPRQVIRNHVIRGASQSQIPINNNTAADWPPPQPLTRYITSHLKRSPIGHITHKKGSSSYPWQYVVSLSLPHPLPLPLPPPLSLVMRQNEDAKDDLGTAAPPPPPPVTLFHNHATKCLVPRLGVPHTRSQVITP